MNTDNKVKNVVVSFDWFWPAIAAITIAFMAFGYGCTGCAECRPPEQAVECVP